MNEVLSPPHKPARPHMAPPFLTWPLPPSHGPTLPHMVCVHQWGGEEALTQGKWYSSHHRHRQVRSSCSPQMAFAGQLGGGV